jgi:ribonuclease D
MKLITDSLELKNLCEELSLEKYITVDTEFLREKTYYPKLCLIQIASENTEFAVDPLADKMDLSPLFEIFANENIIKVFHSARQDIEIILKLSGFVPKPLFDTQVAAMVCGFGASASYATLAAELANANIDKSSRFTDWSRRPLSDKQLSYAISDVTHLRVIYKKLEQSLKETCRSGWLEEEMANLTNPDIYNIDPETIWQRLKPKGTSRRFLGILRELAKWREIKAQQLDRPRGHIINDSSLLEIAAVAPIDVVHLNNIRGLGNLKKSHELEIIEIIAKANLIPENELPFLKKIKKSEKPNESLMELLRVLLKARCEEFQVAEKLVATTEDLSNLAVSDEPEGVISKGWRFDVFGKYAYALKKGDISLSVKNGKIQISQ